MIFRDDVALLRIEHNIGTHALRHFHPHRIAIDADDERRAHQFRTGGRAKTDRSLRKNDDRVADANVGRFRAAESGRGDVGEKHDLFVGQVVGNLGEIGLRVRHEKIFRLCAVDRVAETPAANCFASVAVSALRPLRGQTGATLTARRDRADQDAIANLVTGHAFTEFFNHTDRFVPDNQARTSPDIRRARYAGRFRKSS